MSSTSTAVARLSALQWVAEECVPRGNLSEPNTPQFLALEWSSLRSQRYAAELLCWQSLSRVAGPYAPAVLRFQVALPQQYPKVAPLILFTSDIFHPLVTPLTTYTYTTGSASTDTVSATDEERLLPGGLSLRHGFPKWFEKISRVMPATPRFQGPDTSSKVNTEGRVSSPEKEIARQPLSFHIPPPKEDGFSAEDAPSSIIEVLHYLKRVFEDEALLDEVSLEAAVNPGAWHAWQAHRRKVRLQKSQGEGGEGHKRSMSANVSSPNTPGRAKASGDWNWDGVWQERVKKGINQSLSEPMLYGSVDGDDLVCLQISFWRH